MFLKGEPLGMGPKRSQPADVEVSTTWKCVGESSTYIGTFSSIEEAVGAAEAIKKHLRDETEVGGNVENKVTPLPD